MHGGYSGSTHTSTSPTHTHPAPHPHRPHTPGPSPDRGRAAEVPESAEIYHRDKRQSSGPETLFGAIKRLLGF
jgi:hypothetical protein